MILSGIRVVDCSIFQVGPVAAGMLADLGAEVIKVEQSVSGDPVRGIQSLYGIPLTSGDRHIWFEEHNHNKKGIAINLKTKEGQEVLWKLVAKSDIFITNMRSKAAESLGLDYPTLNLYNPRLIYASSSGFGLKGPEADYPSLDVVAAAKSGIMMASGEEGSPPAFISVGIADRATAFLLAYGILAAILGRERQGIAQEVHVSQLGTMALLQSTSITPLLFTGMDVPRHNRKKPPRNVLFNSYQCKDGRWLVFSTLQWQRCWPVFCRAIGMPELLVDSRFVKEEDLMAHREGLVSILDTQFMTKTSGEWETILRRESIFIFCVANTLSQLVDDVQILANDYVTEWDHPVLGKLRFMGNPLKFSKTSPPGKQPAPALGEHTELVLHDLLGYSWDQIVALKDKEII